MKLILKREAVMEHWRVIATFGFAQRRPEIIAILALADEQADGVITGADVSRKLLAERPEIVGKRLLEVCAMMQLVEQTGPPREGWRLTEQGRRALKNQEVPVPQRGEFDVWLVSDPLHPEVIVRVRPTEPEYPPKQGEKAELSVPATVQDLPHNLRRCAGQIIRPALRLQDEPNELFVFGFENLARCIRREPCQLSVELHSGGGTARFDVSFGDKQTHFAPVAKLPTLAEALTAAGFTEIEKPTEVAFRAISDAERRTARRSDEIAEVETPEIGRFTAAQLTEVPLVPETQQDADEWAVWRLVDNIRDYVWPQDFDKHIRAVREFAVKGQWAFDPVLPTQVDLARTRADQPTLFRRLMVPLDWQTPATLSAPLLLLSGLAAQSKHGHPLVKEWSADLERVYVLEPSELKGNDDGVLRELGKRAVARRVRQPVDVWLRVGPDGAFGQRWHPAPKPTSKDAKTKPPPTTQAEGEWKDIPENETGRVLEELKTAFWNRATQELKAEGGWLAVKPSGR